MEPPIYVVAPGRTYRNETLDARHSPVFHQIEALAVDRGITLADLFGTIETFVRALFDDETRPHPLPLRLLPVHRAVGRARGELHLLRRRRAAACARRPGGSSSAGAGWSTPTCSTAVGIDPEEWHGFAFGFGLERIAMIRYGIDEIKTFFDNDVRFLAQY